MPTGSRSRSPSRSIGSAISGTTPSEGSAMAGSRDEGTRERSSASNDQGREADAGIVEGESVSGAADGQGTTTSLDAPDAQGRWYLHARAIMLRLLATLGFGLHHMADPPAPKPSRTERIESTLSKSPGKDKIQLDIWQPPATDQEQGGRACMIVFHGGGFVLGSGTDDSRWAAVVMEQLDAVVIAVNYRVAPGYPFPTSVEDCADGILHVARNAKRYGIHPDKIVVSGFSAGGNLALASYFLLASPGRWDYPSLDTPSPPIRGIVLFYPLLDFTIARKDKKEASSRPDYCLPDSMTSLFDQSYLHLAPDRSDARISPGLAPDELLKELPPLHLCCCEWDMLYNEEAAFKERLEALGKEVVWRKVSGERHAWDKPPPLTPKKSVVEEYTEAVHSVKRWLGDGAESESGDGKVAG